ncbi:AMP-binding protein [Streptosporangium roseum]|uniref:AMP-binding protein n=1 Tax=Streptosporangium roseum TaxID=2001 RepID=UPI0033329009
MSMTPYEQLLEHAEFRPEALALTLWRDGTASRSWTWRALNEKVDQTLRGLNAYGVQPGDRVVIVLPNDDSFISSMLACSGRGSVAVPAPIPMSGRPAAFKERLLGIVGACDPALIVTAGRWLEDVRELMAKVRLSCPVVSESELARTGAELRISPDRDGLVLLQFTSGSTKRPRGVKVTTASLTANCGQTALAYGESSDDTAVTWVPLFHDMGLVTGLMRPLFQGYRTVLLSPGHFVRDPMQWLRAIDHCGGTLSSAPDFAYELCVRKISSERVPSLNLSRWRVARNAGEVVRTATIRRFAEHFAPAGFRESAFAPSYGLAEATLTVTTSGPGVPVLHLRVSASALARGDITVAEAPDDDVRWLSSSGKPVSGTSVKLAAAAPGSIGEIHVSGPQLGGGYWMEPEGEASADRWHATGDLGFMRDGHLFVLGRADDTLILQGRNIFAVDIAAVCDEFAELRKGRCAAFIVDETQAASAEVRLCAEVSESAPRSQLELNALAKRVRSALVTQTDLFVRGVHLLPKGALPMTTSGKVRVRETRKRYVEQQLQALFLNPEQSFEGAAAPVVA